MAYFLFSWLTVALVVFLCPFYVSAQSTAVADTDFTCFSDSHVSCETYLTFRARSPDYMTLGNISDLFGISRLDIARTNHLPSEDALLAPNQLLLIPINCKCNGTRFFSNATYQIKNGDSFYLVSITNFQNLTNFHVVQDMNPTLKPENLTVGVEAVFPMFCRCPNKTLQDKGIRNLITYVWQPEDNILSVSSMFKASSTDILVENNYRNFTAAICLPVLIPVAQLPVFPQPNPSPHKTHKPKPQQILFAILGTTGAFSILVVACLLVYVHRLCRKKIMLERNSSYSEFSDLIQSKKASLDENFEHKTNPGKLLTGVSGYLDKTIIYEKKVIMEATMNLSDRYRIGGSVYRGMINGEVFAVKIFQDATEELKILQRVNHANLVKLMALSSDNDGNQFLVYEYAENGSLEKWLFLKPSSSSSSSSSGSGGFLSWTQRLNVALDVANGLHYMHEHSQPSIVHGDIRTKNILLNSMFKAKISNFSTARPAASSIALKADIFAFGVMLFELLSGRRAMETSETSEILTVWKEVLGVLDFKEDKGENLSKWMDPNLEDFYPIDGALSLAALAAACTSETSSARPSMTEIVFNLSFLTQSSPEMYQRSWTLGLDPEEALHSIKPVVAR